MDLIQNATPALGLLVLLVLLAWGVRKFRHHLLPGGAQASQALRMVSTLALGPQHRVVLVEMTEPESGRRHLITVGVTAHAMAALHTVALGAGPATAPPVTPPAASTLPPGFQAQLDAQLRADRHE